MVEIKINGRVILLDWILGCLFLAFVLVYYTLAGKISLKLINLKESFFSRTLFTGFIIVTFIQWVIGFPCQLFHCSWKVYFSIMFMVNGCLFIYLIIYFRKGFCLEKDLLTKKVFSHFSKYWFIYLLVIVFSIWSMSSQLPYYIMNYDDHYYLGAIVQQTNSVALSTENFFNGTPMQLGISRLINTFEINYAFWANLFHIYPVFFARAIMVIHNYLLVFMAIHAFFSIFKNIKEKNIQFILISFVALLIPAGYLEQKNIIRVYDGWQMNTAIWYGSSMVRLTCLPVLTMFAFEITEKISFKKIVFFGMLCVSYLSFSSIALPFIIVALLIGWLFLAFRVYQSGSKYSLFASLFMMLVMLFSLKFGPKILEFFFPSQKVSVLESIANYRSMKGYYINDNYLYMLSSSFLLFSLISERNRRVSYVGSVILICVFLCYCSLFDKFFILICMNYDFVALRLITGLQMMLLMFLGFYIVDFIKKFNVNMLPKVSVALIVIICVFNFMNMEIYTSSDFNHAGTGMSVFGYSIDRLVNNDTMAPNIYKDLFDYFDEETRDRHRIINPKIIHYEEGNLFLYAGMSFAADNIEACITDSEQRCDNMTNEEIQRLSDFANGTSSYNDVKGLLINYKIEYILTGDVAVVKELENYGFECVMVSESMNHEILSLIKLN